LKCNFSVRLLSPLRRDLYFPYICYVFLLFVLCAMRNKLYVTIVAKPVTAKINKRKMKDLNEVADNKRQWHRNFIKYTEFIRSHENYKGLFLELGDDNKPKWVVTGKSEKGQRRRAWWDNQCKAHGIKIEAGCYAKVALKVHPTKRHVCQICGRELSIEYVYPSKRTIDRIKKEFGKSIEPFTKTIFEIIDELGTSTNDEEKIRRVFHIKPEDGKSIAAIKEFVQKNHVDTGAKSLSPGVFSNSPDRFDGYHSDGNCCRSVSDKGRHKDNMQRYGQDRRVYENWSDGDWKQADRLMSMFRKHGVSADHIGPISLGFCHRPKFQPMTVQQQSAKNNRMSQNDVTILLADEKQEQIVSWHSKFIWDRLKNKVASDADAVKLSDLMRRNLHYVLIIFSMIDERGHRKFLENMLNPDYSFFDYKFEGFNPQTGAFESVKQIKKSGKNQQNNIDRYYRISFDELRAYKEKENRKVKIWNSDDVSTSLEVVFSLLKNEHYEQARKQLNVVLSKLADLAEKNW